MENGSNKESSSAGITALVCGIVSIVMCWVPLIGLVSAIIGIVFGSKGMKKVQGKGMAIAGLVTGIIGLILSVLYTVFWIWYGVALSYFLSF